MITREDIRKFAILVLDDENGINLKAYDELEEMLSSTDNCDIMEAVDVTEDRAYIGEDVAMVLLTRQPNEI